MTSKGMRVGVGGRGDCTELTTHCDVPPMPLTKNAPLPTMYVRGQLLHAFAFCTASVARVSDLRVKNTDLIAELGSILKSLRAESG